MKRLWIVAVLSTLLISIVDCEDETVSTLRGKSVVLTCPIDVVSCGELHSVKWFKGNERVAVVSGDGTVENVEGQYSGRITIDHNPKGPSTKLNVKAVQVPDEDLYVCETTFLEPMENCDNTGSFSIALKVNVPPSSIQIIDESNSIILNSTTLGPLREGHRFTSTCEVRGTRPSPLVAWYRAGKRLSDSITTDEANGLFTVKSVLSLVLSRQELGAFIECRVETPALENIVSNQLHIDLQVRPTKVELSGVKHHTVQGTNILLQCQVTGARPAANITWYNNTLPLEPEADTEKRIISTKTDFKNDGTFETVSQLVFSATRFENGVSIRCEADNVVMRDDSDKPLHDSLVLEVMYPPVVHVKPDNITVNETGEFLLFCEYDANPASLKTVKWLRDGELVDPHQGRIEGGNPEQTALLIKDASRNDTGSYTCELENGIGKGASENDVDVDIHYVATVRLTMDPDTPIVERYEANVTLKCNVVKGNPDQLLKVRWFLDGQLLKELPECSTEEYAVDDSLCGVNPDVLLLENVGRDFMGNYSCEGMNSAGWGPRSAPNDLIIYYEPGNATLIHYPQIAHKKKSVTFSCSVDDGGNPNATRYRWLRGGSPVMDVVTPIWTVDPVGLDSRTNFSCFAYNDGGNGTAATIELDVHAPQAFIKKLLPYTGVLFSTPTIALSCHVECVPECHIDWFKGGVGIEELNDRYYINSTYLPADPATGDFESTLSVLNFNMTAWPDAKLDIFKDVANYSCVSASKSEGPGVRSVTYFGVEYPPENTTISNETINVEEGSQPPRVSCAAKAYPEPSYEWRRNGERIATGNVLSINRNFTKADDGPYECVSFNKHGNHSSFTHMNVLFRPNCTIGRKEINDEDTLICTAIGNPTEINFDWSLKSDNDTIELTEVRNGDNTGLPASFLILDDDFTVQRTYRCVANNTVGQGQFCEIKVAVLPKRHLMWWQRLDTMTLYILLGVIAAVLLAVIIVCIIIICICRKRRRQDKYHTDLSINTTTQSETTISRRLDDDETATPNQPPTPPRPPPPEIPKSPPKWPLRPGVMVHVKVDTKQNLCASRTQSPALQTDRSKPKAATAPSIRPDDASTQILSTKNTPETNTTAAESVDNNLDSSSVQLLTAASPALDDTDAVHGSQSDATAENTAVDAEPSLQRATATDELIHFTSSSLMAKILGGLRWKRTRATNATYKESRGVSFRGGKRTTNFLRRSARWFGSGKSTKSTNSCTGLFDQHHMSGITCSDSVVTYKKTPVPLRSIPAKMSTPPDDTHSGATTRLQAHKSSINDKSSAAGDPLTDPGEYENLPFHGMQSAPNKFYTQVNTTNSNVVRVAPRPKNPTAAATYNYNLANSFPSNHQPYNIYPTNHPSNNMYPNFSVNSINYTNYPTSEKKSNHNASTTATTNTTSSNTSLSTKQPKRSSSSSGDHPNGGLLATACNPFMATRNGSNKSNGGGEKKFNSLKSMGVKKTPQFYSMRTNKCKRHHSLVGGSDPQQLQILIESSAAASSHSMSYISQRLLNGEPQPLYENLTDSIQIHESSLQNERCAGVYDEVNGGGGGGEFQCDPDERNSIYRSDSGISNSSYECITPVPAPRTHPRKNHSAPVYMNLPSSAKSRALANGQLDGSSHKKHSKCNATASERAFYNYERAQTNPFITSSRRQQILVPKELFPINHLSQQNGNVIPSSSPAATPPALVASTSSAAASARRPVKLPLRKHHSFHFQSSQTVAGSKQLNQQQQQQQQQHNNNNNNNQKKFQHKKSSYKNNGPLVFKPFNGENAFKPIKPVPRSPGIISASGTVTPPPQPPQLSPSLSEAHGSVASINQQHHHQSHPSSEPRICGTSLKRHQSNVETPLNGHHQPRTIKHTTYGCGRQQRIDDAHANDSNCLSDDEHSTPSSSSTSSVISATARGKRLHYADLAPLSGPSTEVPDDAKNAKKHRQYNPLSSDDLDDEMEYADVDYRSYGPINYKAASIYALVKKNKNGTLREVGK